MSWSNKTPHLESEGEPEDYRTEWVLSRQWTLRRNFEGYPFTAAMTTDVGSKIIENFKSNLKHMNSPLIQSLKVVDTEDESTSQRWCSEGLLSGLPLKSNLPILLMSDDSEEIVLRLNDREHLKLTVRSNALSFETLWRQVDIVDDQIQLLMPMAFEPQFGYLNCELEHIGTGLIGEAICHLPALRWTGFIKSIADAMATIGVEIKLLWGDFYTVANQSTIGRDEFELALLLTQVTERLCEKEMAGRETIFESQAIEWENKCRRAYGLLSTAKLLEWEECYDALSLLWMGVDQGWLGPKTSAKGPSRIQVIRSVTPSSLSHRSHQDLAADQGRSFKDLAIKRADLMRHYASAWQIRGE